MVLRPKTFERQGLSVWRQGLRREPTTPSGMPDRVLRLLASVAGCAHPSAAAFWVVPPNPRLAQFDSLIKD